MKLSCYGINHHTCSLADREPFQIQRSELGKATAEIKRISGIAEVIVLATCGRVEFYCADVNKTDPREDIKRFYREQGISETDVLDEFWFKRQGTSAARHLFKVTCGIDSPLLGECQVQGQVKEAYSSACSKGGPGKILHKLFHNAFQVSKRVRSETDIGQGVEGIAGASVDLMKQHLASNLEKIQAIVIGVNKSTELLLERLVQTNTDTIVANRTLYSAEKIANQYHARAINLDDLYKFLPKADVIFSSTSAPGFIVKLDDLSNRDSGKHLLAIDLAIPRDIDPAVAQLENVTLLDLDDLKRYLDSVMNERTLDISRALDYIEEQVRSFEIWRSHIEGNNNVELRQLLDEDRRIILSRFSDNFRQGDVKALEAFSKSLCKQFIRRISSIPESSGTDLKK